MTKIRKKRMRGNDGRRRRRDRERITAAVMAGAGCLFILLIIGLITRRGGNNDKSGTARVGGPFARPHSTQRLGQKATTLETKPPQQAGEKDQKKRKKMMNRPDGLLPMRQALEDPTWDPEATEQARQILSASTNLVNVHLGAHYSIEDKRYSGVVADFCPLNFAAQKEKPPELPMFKDVVRNSHCDEGSKHIIRVDLKEAVELATEFDFDVENSNTENGPTILHLKGVVFHESRCGSTLAANSMMALNPEKHRVYSESAPPITAFRACGEDYSECSLEGSANLLRDIIYIMGRSNDHKEENLFFKFQSVTTRTLETFRLAFPTTPWIFLYRDPVDVMVSQLDVPRISKAICVRSKNSSPMISQFVKDSEYHFDDLMDEEFCAIHLATLCKSALRNIEDADGLGMAVNYSPNLVHDFLDEIFPKHFHTLVDRAGKDRVMEISGTYSKNRGQQAAGEYKPDSEEKKENASQEIKEAANDFLQPVFDSLQQSEHNIIRADEGDDDDEE